MSEIKHLYFFDDLTFHVERICCNKGYTEERKNEIKKNIWKYLLDALSTLDMSKQDFVLVNWEHVCAELGDRIYRNGRCYDVVISQGCNGEYALLDFERRYEQKYKKTFGEKLRNVRVAHFLKDQQDPFYSDFIVGVSKGNNLLEQCKKITDEIVCEKQSVKIAIFDDCIQTGKGTQAVVDNVAQLLDYAEIDYSIDVIAFIGCEDTMRKFYDQGHYIEMGMLLRGKTYPETWENDIYFLKDLLLTNAIRFTDGSSVAYCDIDWYYKIFPEALKETENSYIKLRNYLQQEGLYEELERL